VFIHVVGSYQVYTMPVLVCFLPLTSDVPSYMCLIHLLIVTESGSGVGPGSMIDFDERVLGMFHGGSRVTSFE
jgi:hypothetical protein